ncbi:SNARE-like domain protein [Aeromicrobium marinum DSM 15272]|uniref:SNARE-like domain protein n=1 Tax=Aeromicrobium marinum DSM 15272 TaxID=585531 RepID=E2SDH2_9ACTN|nr:VTT domain-containing protein [Aeromicrobium marinum]EFQ82549.1 SNARE-like domain protein [Aeromicrobium marinum DSM 15272]
MDDLGVVAVLLLGLGVAFAESGIGVGTVVPGETVVVVLAASLTSWPSLLALGACVAVGACMGDHVGYLLGRRFGPRLRETRVIRRVGTGAYDRALAILERRGAAAVFWTRLVPVVRVLTPAAAGVAGLRYRSFVVASVAGSVLWSAVYVAGGSALAVAGRLVLEVMGGAAVPLAVVLAAAGLTLLGVRAARAPRRPRHRPPVALPS